MSSHPEGSASLGPHSRDPKSFSRLVTDVDVGCRSARPRGMAQLGSASALGAEGRRFESGYPDVGPQARSACRAFVVAEGPACQGRTIPRPWHRPSELSTGGQRAGCHPRQSCPMSQRPRRRVSREQRAAVGARLAAEHAGVAHRRDLRAGGVSRGDVRTEVTAGRWTTAGRHTVVIGTGAALGRGRSVAGGVGVRGRGGARRCHCPARGRPDRVHRSTRSTWRADGGTDGGRVAGVTCHPRGDIGPDHGCRPPSVLARVGGDPGGAVGAAPTAPPS